MATRRNQRGRRGGRRAPLRKFVWARWSGVLNPAGQAVDDPNGPSAVNVLSQFENAYGADIIGSTVVRARGAIYPDLEGGAAIRAGSAWSSRLVRSSTTSTALPSATQKYVTLAPWSVLTRTG